ncbi:MAG: IS4 family transposase [Gemmatimonadota bacterium]
MEPLMDEWGVVERLLPQGWQAAARQKGAFRRARYIKDPSTLLRVLLFHAVNQAGLRQSVALLEAAGVARLSQVALFKRLRTSGDWLAWIAARLCESLRERAGPPEALRVVDGTTVQGPAGRGTQWRLHYALDLASLRCDWQELTDAHGCECLERVPVRPGDVLLADRNFFTRSAMAHLSAGRAHALIRLRWKHPRLLDDQGRVCRALDWAATLKAGQVGDWPVFVPLPDGGRIAGRVVAVRLPAPLAERARQKARRAASRKQHRLQPRTLKAAEYVLLFTTLPPDQLGASAVLELYRYRWQVELAFKWLKQLLKLGRVPHQDPQAATGWIQAKLVVALLLESLLRSARVFSPWGYHIQPPRPA